jgi:AcrR family transcriptional regulator
VQGLPAAVRREQLIAAAIRVATEQGIDATTTRRVAKEAGVAVGVVHYCLGTKDNLFREVIKRIVDELLERAVDALQPAGELRESLDRAVEAMWSAVEEDPGLHLLTYELTTYAVRQPGFSDLGRWQYQCYFEATEAFLIAVADRTSTTWAIPVSTLARMMVNLNEGVTLAWLVDRDGAQARAVYEAFADHLVGLAHPVGEPVG